MDPVSRLTGNDGRERGLREENKMNSLLQEAKKDLKKAIDLDSGYKKAYLNFACALGMLGNMHFAVGILDELPSIIQKDMTVNLVKAIVYYNANEKSKAAICFDSLLFGVDSIINYNLMLYQLRDDRNGIDRFMMDWQQRNGTNGVISDSLKGYFGKSRLRKDTCQNISNKMQITVCSDTTTNTVVEIIIDKEKLKVVRLLENTDILRPMVKDNDYWLINNLGRGKKWLVKQL